MKTLLDFKGTQGEFIKTVNGFGDTILANQRMETVVNFDGSDVEVEANAKLFANSKKVLEAAIILLTAVKDGLPIEVNDPIYNKLEQAINNSL